MTSSGGVGGYIKRWHDDRGVGLRWSKKGWRNLCTAPHWNAGILGLLDNRTLGRRDTKTLGQWETRSPIHWNTWTLGQWETRTMGHRDNGTTVKWAIEFDWIHGLDTIHEAHLNWFPFNYYISILGEGNMRQCLFIKGWKFQDLGAHAYVILECSIAIY